MKWIEEPFLIYIAPTKYYRDLKNSLDTAKGEGKIEIAKKMIKKGLDIETIIELTGLPLDIIKGLL